MFGDEQQGVPSSEDFPVARPHTSAPEGEARLIQELQAMYEQEKNGSIERVWTRLEQQRSGVPGTMFALRQPGERAQRPFFERNKHMQYTNKVSSSKKELPFVLGFLAAALVGVVVIGSFLFVMNGMKGPQTPGTGAQPAGVSSPTAAATKTPISQPECRDNNDIVDQQLCLAHKEAILNLHKDFGAHKVIFLRAYADHTRLLLVYTTSDAPTSDAISFMSVNIQSGITLTGGGSTSYQNPVTHQLYYVVSFTTQNVPAGTTKLQLKSIVDAFSGQPTSLGVSIPFHQA